MQQIQKKAGAKVPSKRESASADHRSGMADGAKGPTSPAQSPGQVAAGGFKGLAGSLPYFSTIQASFGGHDVSTVQAYHAPDAAAALGATAYAQGERVAFADKPGLHTAAHEAAHVVQQRQGVQVPGEVGRPGDAYERHADAVADRVVAGRSAADMLGRTPASASGASKVVQKATPPSAVQLLHERAKDALKDKLSLLKSELFAAKDVWKNLPSKGQLGRHNKHRTVTTDGDNTVTAADALLKPENQPPTKTPLEAAQAEEEYAVTVNTELKKVRRWHRQLERQMPEVSGGQKEEIKDLVKLVTPPENNASDENVVKRLAAGDLSPQHGATARSNVVYHAHYHSGSGGISFAYIEHDGDLYPVLADYAPTRQRNDYMWTTAGRSGGAGLSFEAVQAAVKQKLGWD